MKGGKTTRWVEDNSKLSDASTLSRSRACWHDSMSGDVSWGRRLGGRFAVAVVSQAAGACGVSWRSGWSLGGMPDLRRASAHVSPGARATGVVEGCCGVARLGHGGGPWTGLYKGDLHKPRTGAEQDADCICPCYRCLSCRVPMLRRLPRPPPRPPRPLPLPRPSKLPNRDRVSRRGHVCCTGGRAVVLQDGRNRRFPGLVSPPLLPVLGTGSGASAVFTQDK